jgi:hypothetical protein
MAGGFGGLAAGNSSRCRKGRKIVWKSLELIWGLFYVGSFRFFSLCIFGKKNHRKLSEKKFQK